MIDKRKDMSERKTGLALLREPFPANQISKLPKPYKKDSPKGKCPECGGWHGLPAVHLDYVGHAALTDRLLDADPSWTWEPMAIGDNGYPVIDGNGGMWIKLTVCGVTRLGYGDAQGKTGGDAMKERIGDALRNAAMRFGAALDLWHKGDLHTNEDEDGEAAPKQKRSQVGIDENAVLDHLSAIGGAGSLDELKIAYTAAVRAARMAGDIAAEKRFEDSKEARKLVLTDVETGVSA